MIESSPCSPPVRIPNTTAKLPDQDYARVLDYQLYRFSRRVCDAGISVSPEDLQPNSLLMDTTFAPKIQSEKYFGTDRSNLPNSSEIRRTSSKSSAKISRTASSSSELMFGLDL